MQAHGAGRGKTRHRDHSASTGRRPQGTAVATPPESRRRPPRRADASRAVGDGAYDDQPAVGPVDQAGPDYQAGHGYQVGPEYEARPSYRGVTDDRAREEDVGDESRSSSDYYDWPHRHHSRKWCSGKCTCCTAAMVMLLVPLLILMFPYVKYNIYSFIWDISATGLEPSTAQTTSPATSTSASATSTSSTAKSTESARKKIEQDCTKKSASDFEAAHLEDVKPAPFMNLPTAPVDGPQAIYCIYNVTRIPRGRFLPLHLPLAVCPSVVYWSWSLPGGVLTSRAQEFDETYGLAAVEEAARQQKVNVQLFLALGGFREDSVDFHKVGRDPVARQRLVQDLFNASTLYNLSGIILHWVPNGRACEDFYGGGVPQLGEFVDSLTRLVSLNMPGAAFKVAALVDPQEASEMEFYRAIKNYLSLTFFKTHHVLPSHGFANYCANSIPVFHSQLALLKALFQKPSGTASPPSHPYDDFCVSISLSLYARQGDDIGKPASAQPVSATPGHMALFEVCDSHVRFHERVPFVAGCIVKRSSSASLNVMIAYDTVDTLRRKMSYFGPMKDLCVLIYDVDFDNYLNNCTGHSERFLMMRHFLSGRVDKSTFKLVFYLP